LAGIGKNRTLSKEAEEEVLFLPASRQSGLDDVSGEEVKFFALPHLCASPEKKG